MQPSPDAYLLIPPMINAANVPQESLPTVTEDSAQRIYLGVEESKIELVEEGGYFTHMRQNIAVSESPAAAREGCLRWHPYDRAVVFEALSRHFTDDISLFTNGRGCLRLNTRHLPANFLRKLSV